MKKGILRTLNLQARLKEHMTFVSWGTPVKVAVPRRLCTVQHPGLCSTYDY
jgi:hypothetical protein